MHKCGGYIANTNYTKTNTAYFRYRKVYSENSIMTEPFMTSVLKSKKKYFKITVTAQNSLLFGQKCNLY